MTIELEQSFPNSREKVSIVVLTYNAPRYCAITLKSLARTRDVDYEVVVVDNNSRLVTKLVLFHSYLRGWAHRLCFLNQNILFSGGNNVGALLGSRDATHVLLLNSDVEVRDGLWLRKLLDVHVRGISAYGYISSSSTAPARADGYCFLIDRDLYERHQLSEEYKWWWGITELQAKVLREGWSVRAVAKHDHVLVHFGGKSGTAHLRDNADNFRAPQDILQWFSNNSVERIETV